MSIFCLGSWLQPWELSLAVAGIAHNFIAQNWHVPASAAPSGVGIVTLIALVAFAFSMGPALRFRARYPNLRKGSDLRWQTPESPSERAQGLYIGFCIETVL